MPLWLVSSFGLRLIAGYLSSGVVLSRPGALTTGLGIEPLFTALQGLIGFVMVAGTV